MTRYAPEMSDTAPITARFNITDDDIEVLRRLKPKLIRIGPLERWLFLYTVAPSLAVGVGWYFLGARIPGMFTALFVFAALWTLFWGTMLCGLLRSSSPDKASFKKLVQLPVLNAGECTATIHPEDSRLDLVTHNGSYELAQDDLESWVQSIEYFYITTMGGQAIIIPRRAFESFDQWFEFVRNVQTRNCSEETASES